MCDRFRKLPEEILAADSMIFELLELERRYGRE